ncbi:galactokinase [Kitasatospora sp. MMS16-BH015]|uniref:galactokinase n=1 Tax=Kitasatospora sp. MMS16-BH015 TaxID=2018025 RepID=UPI000CA17AD9|nr:galactokinase [Kitasatospora sp. MMS16-BH015]AUG80535.1 galactokinase [Kitasatospora sp. MMS16-BH015]
MELLTRFAQRFGAEPEGVWAAPGRVNLIGEHTDYNEGFALPFAIDRHTRAAARRRTDDTVRVASSAAGFAPVEIALDEADPEKIEGWAAYPLGVLLVLRGLGHRVPGLDIMVESEVPVGAGLSSSAALCCSVALAVNELAGLGLSPQALVEITRQAENQVAGAPTGPLDQSASLLGVRDAAVLLDCRTLAAEPLPLGLDAAGLTILVLDTRAEHAHCDGGYAARRAGCEQAARTLGVPALRDLTEDELTGRARHLLDPRSYRLVRHVVTENARVLETAALLESSGPGAIGPLLTASHASLRDDFQVSCAELDAAVEAALGAGALGARMTGGGFGGSAIALVPVPAAEAVAEAVTARFAVEGFAEPSVFAVRADEAAHRLL